MGWIIRIVFRLVYAVVRAVTDRLARAVLLPLAVVFLPLVILVLVFGVVVGKRFLPGRARPAAELPPSG